MNLPNIVAVVGCDGSGKTTLVRDLVRILAEERQVRRRYMGLISGEAGDRIKRLPGFGVWLERRLAAKVRRAQDMAKPLPGPLSAVVMYGFSLWRAAAFRRVARLSESGMLVIADRWPQAEVPGFHYDGPGLEEGRSRNPLVRALAGAEQRIYDRLATNYPRLIIRLTIDPMTAFSRKPDHPLPELADKIEKMARIGYAGTTVREIDARLPYPLVLEAALASIRATDEPASDAHPEGTGSKLIA